MKRRVSFLVAIILTMSLIQSGCGTSSAESKDAKPDADEKTADETEGETEGETEEELPPIKIGQIVAITGSFVDPGSNEKRGAELAVEEINAAGGINGRQIVLVQEDGQSTNEGAVQALQKLLEDEEICFIIGPSPSTQDQACLPTIDEVGIPFGIGGTSTALTHSGSPWVFRFRPNDEVTAKNLTAYAVNDMKYTKIAILHSTDSFGTGGMESAVAQLKELGITDVTIVGYNNEEKDFTGVINTLKSSGAECMITFHTLPADIGILAQQIKQQGLEITWLSNPAIFSVAATELGGDALNNTYGVMDFLPAANDVAKHVNDVFNEKYGKDADYYVGRPYDSVYCFAEAAKKAPGLEPDALREAFLDIQGYQGANGIYNFDEFGDGLHNYNIVQRVDGELVVVKGQE